LYLRPQHSKTGNTLDATHQPSSIVTSSILDDAKTTNSPASLIRRGFFSYTQQPAVTGGDLKRKWPHHVGLKVTRCGLNQ
jgi:hypothetical protein